MWKLLSENFCLFQALEHEAVAMGCKDPVMREIWLLTAAAWREADDCRRLRRVDGNRKSSPVVDFSGARIGEAHKSL